MDPDEPEKWRDCPSFPGYQASSRGRLRSVDRVLQLSDGRSQTHRGQLLNPNYNKDRFWVATSDRRTRQVAALVLDAFAGPRPGTALACHDDGDPCNNAPENLYWGNKSSNALDSVRHGTHGKTRKKVCPRDHLLVEPNLVASQARNGHRSCLSCDRAWSRVKNSKAQGVELDMQEESDLYYAKIMSCESCLHDSSMHTCDGCLSRDDLGNRCACVQEGP